MEKSEKLVEITGLKKSFGAIEAVRGIDFYVEKGKLFAFLGPNGAGKSTTINMMCTFLKPDAGRVVIDSHELGKDDDAIRKEIGVVFQDSVLDDLLSVKENLWLRGSFYGIPDVKLQTAIERAADVTAISDFISRPYGKLSGGQRRRADIARSLINTPKLLFLDEPTTGLDPQTRKSVWNTIREMQRKTGMTVFLTTHYMEEAAEADYVIVIDNGQIAAKGTPTELKDKYANDVLKLTAKDNAAVLSRLKSANIEYTTNADVIIMKIPNTMSALPIVEMLKDDILVFEVLHGTMDDAFIGITGKEIRR